MKRGHLLTLIAFLYVVEGMPFGVVNELVPVWLKLRGLSLQDLGLVTLVGLPWTLKALWAPLVDRYGTARHWLLGALGAQGLGYLAMTRSPEPLALAGCLLLIATASATQDIAIDGYSAGAVPTEQQGRVNGIRVTAYRLAMLASGGGLVALAPFLSRTTGQDGWVIAFGVLAALTALQAMVVWRSSALTVRPAPTEAFWSELGGWLFRADTLAVVAFVLLFKLGDGALGPMVKPFWLDHGRTTEEVGLVTISFGTGLTLVGALLGGEGVSRWGLARGLWFGGAVQAASNLGYLVAATWPSRATIYGASVVESLSGGLGTAAFLAALMALCAHKQAATRFALLTALAGLTRILVGAVSGIGAQHMGYGPYFALTAVLGLPGLFLVPAVARRAAALTRSASTG